MAVFYSPKFNATQFKSDGTLANGYKIYTYAEGSTTPLPTYTTSLGSVAQANPIVLNARGETANPIWLTGGLGYKLVLTTDADVVVRTEDNIRGVGDAALTLDQWIASGLIPTFISVNSFSLVGDQTSTFHIGRRLKSTVSAGTAYSTITNSVFTTLTTITVTNDSTPLDSGLSAVSYGLLSNQNSSFPSYVIADPLQKQTFTAFTTAGTSTAYTLTPVPAITSLVTNQKFHINFHTTAGASPTLAISGLTAKNLKYKDSSGTKQTVSSVQIPSGWLSDVEYDGTDYVVLTVPPTLPSQVFPITASVGSNAMTLTLNPTSLDFRSSTITSGTVNTRTVAAAISTVISSGSTGGTKNNTEANIAVLAIDNSGTVELAWCNASGLVDLDESKLISTTAEGGAGAADSATVIYSTTARSNVPFRIVGFVTSVQTTAGTWAAAPTKIQGAGGTALSRLPVGYYTDSKALSGTSTDFTGIPAWVNKIEGVIYRLDTSGTDIPIVQVGVGGTPTTTGYTTIVANIQAAAASGGTGPTSGFPLSNVGVATAAMNGAFTLQKVYFSSAEAWIFSSNMGMTVTRFGNVNNGEVSLSDNLDMLRITTDGTNTFDGGTVVIRCYP